MWLTLNVTTEAATAVMITSRNKRKPKRQFFSAPREPLC